MSSPTSSRMLGSLAPVLPGASRPARGAPSAAARLAAASSAVVASAARISSPLVERKCSELGRKAVAVLPCCGQLCELRHREAARLGSAAVCVASGRGALVRCARGPRVVRSDSGPPFMRGGGASDLKDLKVKAHSGGVRRTANRAKRGTPSAPERPTQPAEDKPPAAMQMSMEDLQSEWHASSNGSEAPKRDSMRSTRSR
jgi:hypothetical protein